MLIQMKEIKTKTYPLDQGFTVDITTKCKKYEAWIYHKDYGIKELMFGVDKSYTYDEFLNLVEKNVDEYIEYYKKYFMN